MNTNHRKLGTSNGLLLRLRYPTVHNIHPSVFVLQKSIRHTAYHEAGHALVALFTPGADPLHKATINPRGPALGLTWQMPPADEYSRSLSQLRASVDVCMGGQVRASILPSVNRLHNSELLHLTLCVQKRGLGVQGGRGGGEVRGGEGHMSPHPPLPTHTYFSHGPSVKRST